MRKTKVLLASLFLALPVDYAYSQSYADACVKMIGFHIPSAAMNDTVRKHLTEMCVCQERELRKRGVSDAELKAFTKNAGTAALDAETMRVAPKVNGILQSEEVKKNCGSLF